MFVMILIKSYFIKEVNDVSGSNLMAMAYYPLSERRDLVKTRIVYWIFSIFGHD